MVFYPRIIAFFSTSCVSNENLQRICLKAKTFQLDLCYISRIKPLYREINMNNYRSLLFAIITLLLTTCQSAPTCPPVTGTPQYLTDSDLEQSSLSTPDLHATPTKVEINGNMMAVDKVVTGPLCNDNWKGSVYVACNVQVFKWEEKPLFLKNCNLTIEPATVVYVAYHNDAAYYNGCSCHTGEQP